MTASFVKERNEALFSLDRQRITEYFRKRGSDVPENDTVFWAAVYKCICNIKDAPAELKEHAEMWLRCHGMSSKIAVPRPYIHVYK